MTRQLTATLKRKARIIHGQILGTELLVKECGGDVEQAVERHFEMLHDIYAEEFLLAALTDSSDLLLLYEGNAISSEALPLTFFSSKMREISSALTKVARTTVSLNHAAGHKRPSDFRPSLFRNDNRRPVHRSACASPRAEHRFRHDCPD